MLLLWSVYQIEPDLNQHLLVYHQNRLFTMMSAEVGNTAHKEVTNFALAMTSHNYSHNSKGFCSLAHHIAYRVRVCV